MAQINNSEAQIKENIRRETSKLSHMTRIQLVEQLKLRNLETEGVKTTLEKRLSREVARTIKNKDPVHKVRHVLLDQSSVKVDRICYYIVIDFEATCCKEDSPSYKQEIIEFPAVLIDVKKGIITKEFHSYVRPVLNPILTDFCTNLTGIVQDTVDKAPEFLEVFQQFEQWLLVNKCTKKNCVIVTDGNWDMSKFMYIQCKWSKLLLPWWSRMWMDIRQVFKAFYKLEKVCLSFMLRYLSMTFQGRQHSGIDDSRNIARILMKLMESGCEKLESNQQIIHYRLSENKRMHEKWMEEREEDWSENETEKVSEEIVDLQIK